MNRMLPEALRRYLVTDIRAGSVAELVVRCAQAVDGGVTAIQLRAKGWSDRELLTAARELRQLCTDTDTLFIVNDRVDIALASDADGVHLGVDDLPVGDARRLLGPDAIIGYSPETDADRLAAEVAGADYLGIGPVFGTTTKPDAGAAIGLDGLRRIIDRTKLPVVAIGGVSVESAASAIDAGSVGVALVGAIFLADDPRAAAARLREVVP